MFTGIIQARGRLRRCEQRGGDRRLHLDCGPLELAGIKAGDSIAVNGVCLTVVEISGQEIVVDVSRETLRCTTFARLAAGAVVNLEKALLPTTALGGHLVSGHVDGVGEVLERVAVARSLQLRIQVPAELARYIAAKGSVCVDGVSLTVNTVDGAVFSCNIIPHTQVQTIIGEYRPGCAVNVEVDLVSRYIERLLSARLPDRGGAGMTAAMLAAQGFNGGD